MSEHDTTTEKSILEAAEQLFMTKGFASTRTTEIARLAGVNHAMLHYYFRTKENLFNKVFEEKICRLAESFISAFEQELTLEEKVRRAIGWHFDFLVANPKLPMFILREILSDEERKAHAKKLFQPQIIKLLGNVQDAIDEEVRRGNIRWHSAIHVLLNAVSLNVFAIVAMQLLSDSANTITGDMDAFLTERRENNIRLILNSLKI
ncbi:MAG: TetR/AcrR family transcriptional regulator [Bacteroidales bacterium]|jgi:AcrR family transcriptional regulator|nr:TetR/AcrR family transcriptional regulator [Bacteroidales bacterium]